jgi:hypothetical protein
MIAQSKVSTDYELLAAIQPEKLIDLLANHGEFISVCQQTPLYIVAETRIIHKRA